MPIWDDAFRDWLRDYDILAWAGLVLGVVGVLASPMFGWPVSVLVGFGILGIIAGALLVAIFLRSPEDPFKCWECEKIVQIRGIQGADATGSERKVLKATKAQSSFLLAKMRRDGTVSNEQVRYRNRGKSLKAAAPNYILLGPAQVFYPTNTDGTTDVLIQPPAPVRRGEIIEILRTYDLVGAFPNTPEEFVGKAMLWPTTQLSFRIEFVGLDVTDCQGLRYDRSLVAASAVALNPTKSAQGWDVEWTPLSPVIKGENCRVTWRWI